MGERRSQGLGDRGAAVAAGIILILAVGAFFGAQAWRAAKYPSPANVPETNVAIRNTNGASNANTTTNANTPVAVPAELNLSAPFTSQAPDANWDEDHEDFCEEASVLMAARALQGRTIRDTADAEKALQEIKRWQLDNLGFFKSTTAAETARIIREFYELPARLLPNPSVQDLKTELAAGRFVIVPAAGRLLGNPNFRSPGPLYHMLLLKGYTTTGKFITHDPGTRNGRNYVYAYDVLMNAIHDWNNGDVPNGDRVVIVVGAGADS